ncbi:MAG TPA: methyl-accepting chemotaxis protein [Candidatus Binatia bacterium]|nr:methyl-accepting chemotaxis protein [Candidatus Binatia bacterium]
MGRLGLLHRHPVHRSRQLRWVVPLVGLLLLAGLAALAVQYRVGDRAIGTEFFRAHKTIHRTGELLRRGTMIAGVLLLALAAAITLAALRFTRRIVCPVHALHRALDALAAGELGVRVALHRTDEFHEVGEALNRLVDELATTLATVHALVDRVAALSEAGDPAGAGEVRRLIGELDRTMDFFRLEPRRTIDEDGE